MTNTNEAATQAAIRVEAARRGIALYRNNVGVLLDKRGVPVRFGLANDSPAINSHIKSGDLIGIRPVTVTSEMVGTTIGVFVSREVKAAGWHYTGTAREQAQQRWIDLVRSYGGDASFASGPGSFD